MKWNSSSTFSSEQCLYILSRKSPTFKLGLVGRRTIFTNTQCLYLLGLSVVENCNSNIYINYISFTFPIFGGYRRSYESAGCVDTLNSPVDVVW